MILMKEYVSLTTAAMKMDKRHFYSNHSKRACHPYIMDFLEIFTSGSYQRYENSENISLSLQVVQSLWHF